ncbi:FMRFamide-related protein [Elysia marginata]|uniref:FMRFamide-related protein n=1 Tax=Elysia marginata TaxID=1093978 RepID=A0AAV4HFF8_9GAST|nr:FMRFamide-related protein [Elysia marginata]
MQTDTKSDDSFFLSTINSSISISSISSSSAIIIKAVAITAAAVAKSPKKAVTFERSALPTANYENFLRVSDAALSDQAGEARKRHRQYMRFGRSVDDDASGVDEYLRFGDPFLRFGKGDPFLRFGKKSSHDETDPAAQLIPLDHSGSQDDDDSLRKKRDLSSSAEIPAASSTNMSLGEKPLKTDTNAQHDDKAQGVAYVSGSPYPEFN